MLRRAALLRESRLVEKNRRAADTANVVIVDRLAEPSTSTVVDERPRLSAALQRWRRREMRG
eukprot:12926605-Prorocentrum_lima.AAC.1